MHLWFKLFQSEDLLFFFVLHQFTLDIFGFTSVGRTIQDIWRSLLVRISCHFKDQMSTRLLWRTNQQINRQWMIPDRFTSTHLHQKWIRSTTQTAVTWPTVVVVVFLVLLQLRPNLGLILCAPLSWSEVRLRGSFSCFSSCLSPGTSWPWLLRPVTHRATHLRLWFWPSTSRYSSPMNRHDAEPHNCSSASNLKTNQFTPKTFIPPCVQIVFLSKSAVV